MCVLITIDSNPLSDYSKKATETKIKVKEMPTESDFVLPVTNLEGNEMNHPQHMVSTKQEENKDREYGERVKAVF